MQGEGHTRERLGFTFRLLRGAGRLALDQRQFFGWLDVDHLELAVPDLQLPINLAEGPELFQRRRTVVRAATLRLDQDNLDAFVARRAAAVGDHGIADMQLRCCDGYLSAVARVRDGNHAADLTYRIFLCADDRELRALVADAQVCGYLPTPAPLWAHRSLVALVDAASTSTNGTPPRNRPAAINGLNDISLAPLGGLLWNTMPAAGWRLPSTGDVALTGVRVTRSGLQLRYGPAQPDQPDDSRSTPRAGKLGQALTRLCSADEQLLAGDLDAAQRAYRAELATSGFDQPLVLSRLLALASTQPGYFVDGIELARQVLGRWPDFAAAHAALASIAVFGGDTREAAQRFELLARANGTEGDLSTSRAALAAARILRMAAPTQATPLYEQVLGYERRHAEAAEALAERYTDEQRWHDLERLIRERIAGSTDAMRESRDRVRLANVLWQHIGDTESARAELERATELDADNIAALETLAELHLAGGDATLAIRALDGAIRSLENRGEDETAARLHARVGDIWQQVGDDDTANARYQRGLELAPQLDAALTGAARIAERKGSFETAAQLWSQLIESGGHPTVVNAEYTCELARCMVASGDTEAAIPMLERVADLGRPDTIAEAHTLLAEVYLADGDRQLAVEELGTAIAALIPAIDEKDAELTIRAAKLALRRAALLGETGDEFAATKNYEHAYQLARRHDATTAHDAARALLDAAGKADDDAATQRWIEALLETDTEDTERVELLLARARIAAAGDQKDQALADVDDALAAAPGGDLHAEALGLKAWILGSAGDPVGKARALAERAALARGDTDTISAEAAAAEAWLEADDRAEALAAAGRAAGKLDQLDEHAHDIRRRVLTVLGEAAWRSRDWNKVQTAYTAVFASPDIRAGLAEADDAVFSHRLGIALANLGERDAAAVALTRATMTAACPGEVRAAAYKLLADIYVQLDRPLYAARILEQFAGDDTADATDAARADAWYRAGDAYRKQDEHADDAERCLDAALRVAQDHLPALDALEHIKRQQRDYERVAVILGRKIAATAKHPNRQKALLARLAELQLHELDRPDVARATYSRSLELDPDYRPALRFFATTARDSGDDDEAIATYLRLAADLPGDVDLPGDAASLLEERIDAAIAAAALARRGQDDRVVAAVARAVRVLLDAAPDDERLYAVLEVLAPGGEGEAETETETETEAETETETETAAEVAAEAEADTGRADSLRAEAAELVDSDPNGAADLLAESVAVRARALAAAGAGLDTGLAGTLEQLRELSEDHECYAQYAAALRTGSAVEPDSRRAAQMLRQAAELLSEKLGDPRGAADALARALAEQPADSQLLAALIGTLDGIDDHAAKLDAYELHLQAVEGRDRARPLFELGQLHDELRGDVDTALDYYAQAHTADPEMHQPWLPLAFHHKQRGELGRARLLYKLALDRQPLSDDDRAAVQAIVAELDESMADAADDAMEAFLHAAARVEDELRLGKELERAGQIDAAIAHYEAMTIGAPQDLRPLECLVPLYRAKHDVDALTELLGRMIVITESRQRRAQLWYERAKLYKDELHREPETYRCLKEAFANDPENPTIASALRSIAMARGEWALAAELIYREIDNATDDREAGALHLELALIFDEKLLDADQALRNYEQAIALDDDIPAAPLPLARLYELAGRHADAARMGERAAEYIDDDDERGRVLKHAAISAERAGDAELARRLYNAAALAVSDDDDSRAAQAALARLAGDHNNATSTELLQLRLLEAESLEEKVGLLHDMLEIATNKRDTEAMRKHAETLLDVDHTDLTAYLTLKAQAEDRRDWATLARIISVRAGAIDDVAERAALYNRLGRICQNELRDVNQAIAAYRNALAAAPDHPGALESLADIAYRRHDWNTAHKLYNRLEPEACAMPEDALAFRRAEIAEALGKDDEALEAFRAVTRLNSTHRAAFKGIARTAIRIADTATAIDATKRLLELLPRDNVRAITSARLRLAQMCHHAGDAPAAIDYYEMVLAQDPHSLPTLRALTALYRERGQYKAAAKTQRALVGLAQSPGERAQLLYDLGELYRRELADSDLAADAYLKGIDLDPAHVPTLRRLIDYYWRIDEPEALLEIVDDLADQTALLHEDTEPESLARAMIAAACLERDQLARDIGDWLADETPGYVADALLEGASHSVHTTPAQLAQAAQTLAKIVANLHFGQIIVLVEGEIEDEAGRRLLDLLRTLAESESHG